MRSRDSFLIIRKSFYKFLLGETFLEPNDVIEQEAFLGLGILNFEDGHYSQAISNLKSAEEINLEPRKYLATYYLALCYEKIGKFRKTRSTLQRIIKEAPKSKYAKMAKSYRRSMR